MIKFYRGLQEKYLLNPSNYADSLYFATDKGVLYLNGKSYGSEFPYSDVELEGNELILTFRDETLGENGKKVINLVEQIQLASATQAGLMSAEYAALLDELGRMKEAEEFGKVDGVVESDKILSVSEKLISATLDLHYGEEGDVKYIYLLGKPSEAEDAVEGRSVVAKLDAAPFIADGMLEDAEFITNDEGVKGIKFTWNVVGEDGQYKTDFVPLTDLIVEYSAGNGISVENNVVSVKLDQTKARNLLSVSADGLSLESVTTDATILDKDIVVAGIDGVLGTGGYKNGDVIRKGTDIYTILQNILCKEQYPEACILQNASLTSAYDDMTVTVKSGTTTLSNNTTVEVGTSVTISGKTGYDPKPTAKPRTYDYFEYGYVVVTEDGEEKYDGNPANVNVTDIEICTGTYTLKREYTSGYGSTTSESSSTSTSSSDCSLDDKTLVVGLGNNTVKYTMSGPGHQGSVASSPKYYIVSNLGKTDKTKYYVDAVASSNPSQLAATSGTGSHTVKGNYKYYVGYAASKPTTTSDIKKLTTFTDWMSNSITKGSSSSKTPIGTLPDGNIMCIAVPSTYKLKSIINKEGFESSGSFDTTASPAYTVKYELADKSTVDYTVYNMSSIGDWGYVYFEIVKK